MGAELSLRAIAPHASPASCGRQNSSASLRRPARRAHCECCECLRWSQKQQQQQHQQQQQQPQQSSVDCVETQKLDTQQQQQLQQMHQNQHQAFNNCNYKQEAQNTQQQQQQQQQHDNEKHMQISGSSSLPLVEVCTCRSPSPQTLSARQQQVNEAQPQNQHLQSTIASQCCDKLSPLAQNSSNLQLPTTIIYSNSQRIVSSPAASSSSSSSCCVSVANACGSLLCRLHSLLALAFPVLNILAPGKYSLPTDLVADLIAGFTVGVFQIPQSMAYALLAGAEPVQGLYVSFINVGVMALLSDLRHLSFGTFAGTSLIFKAACSTLKLSLLADANYYDPSEDLTTSPPLVLVNNHKARPTIATATTTLATPSMSFVSSQLPLLLPERMRIGHNEPSISAIQPKILGATTTTTTTVSTIIPQQHSHSSILLSAPTLQPTLPMPSQTEMLSSLCLLVGIVQLSLAAARLGAVSSLFNEHLVSGFTTASALHVVTSQLDGLFDIEPSQTVSAVEHPFKIIQIWRDFALRVTHDANIHTTILTTVSIVYLLTFRYILEPFLKKQFTRLPSIPIELSLMLAVTFASTSFNFNSKYNIKILGKIPTGFATIKLPRIDYAQYLILDSILISAVTIAMVISMGANIARKHRYEINGTRELTALGTSNIVASIFACLPTSVSLSRTAILSSLNPKSQLCSLISCSLVLSVILYLAPLLHNMPKSTLSCIVVVALAQVVMQVRELLNAFNESKLDGLVWLATFIAVLAFDMIGGLASGLALSLAVTFCRLLYPRATLIPATYLTAATTTICNNNISNNNINNSNNNAEEVLLVKESNNLSINSKLIDANTKLTNTNIDDGDNAAYNNDDNDDVVNRYSMPVEMQNVFIVRPSSPLCYLNRAFVRRQIEQSLRVSLKQGSYNNTTNNNNNNSKKCVLIIDCCAFSFVDFAGATTLLDMIEDLHTKGTCKVLLANCSQKLLDKLPASGEFINTCVCSTLSSAFETANYYQHQHQHNGNSTINC